jgi:hypothetical protein
VCLCVRERVCVYVLVYGVLGGFQFRDPGSQNWALRIVV